MPWSLIGSAVSLIALRQLREKIEELENDIQRQSRRLREAVSENERMKEINEDLERKIEEKIVENQRAEEALKNTNEDLKRKILEADGKAKSLFSENARLKENNARLGNEVKDLEEKLSTAVAEREICAQQLAALTNTVTELTERHSKVSELHSAAEARISEVEAHLAEAIQKSSLKDSEAKDLHEKLKASEEQALEASALLKSRDLELEQILLKSRDLESELERRSNQFKKDAEALVEENSKLTQVLASLKSELSDLQTKLSIVSSEKDATGEELNSARKEIEELKQMLVYEGQKLQAQISSVMEENNLLNETFQNSKKDFQTMIEHLEEQLKEQKSNEDALKAKLEILIAEGRQKAELQNHLKQLEEQLATAEARLREEKELSSQRDLEREAALKHSLQELEAKKKELLLKEDQVKDLEHRLGLADAKSKGKDTGVTTTEQKDETKRSRRNRVTRFFSIRK